MTDHDVTIREFAPQPHWPEGPKFRAECSCGWRAIEVRGGYGPWPAYYYRMRATEDGNAHLTETEQGDDDA